MKRWRKTAGRRGIGLLLAAVFLLTACGKAHEEAEPGKITLELWYYWDGSDAVSYTHLDMGEQVDARL